MAGDEKTSKKAYPVVPTAHWWALRRKFQQSIPGVVTANYVASVLKMKEDSARANVLTGLKLAGVVDKDGKPTERAKAWRDDERYAAVCREIRDECYPEELRSAFPNPSEDADGVTRWFANHTGGGEAVVEKKVKFYLLLNEGDVSKAAELAKPVERAKQPKAVAAPRAVSATRNTSGPTGATPEVKVPERATVVRRDDTSAPSIHINLQVHISADASTDQIEQVFSSMARHIYKKVSE
jgi:hypothetical protein